MATKYRCPECGFEGGMAVHHWGTGEVECDRCRHDFKPVGMIEGCRSAHGGKCPCSSCNSERTWRMLEMMKERENEENRQRYVNRILEETRMRICSSDMLNLSGSDSGFEKASKEKSRRSALAHDVTHFSSKHFDKPVFGASMANGLHTGEKMIAPSDKSSGMINFLSDTTGRSFEQCHADWLMKNAGKAPTIKTDYKSLVDWGGQGTGPSVQQVANFMCKETGCEYEAAYMHLITPKVSNSAPGFSLNMRIM